MNRGWGNLENMNTKIEPDDLLLCVNNNKGGIPVGQ